MPSDPGRVSEATTKVFQTDDTRLIIALMAWAVGFGIVGREISQMHTGTPSVTAYAAGGPPAVHPVVSGTGKIIVGGFAAAAFLSLLSHAGEPGRSFAVGLAVLTAATSMLVYGGPVWTQLAYITSGAPGAKPTGSTVPSAPTAPTVGTVNTVTALAKAA